MKPLGIVSFHSPGEPSEKPKDKSPLETIERILAASVALSSVLFAQWGQHPWLAALLALVALLLIASAFGPGLLRSYRAARAQRRRNKFARAQCPQLVEFAKRFDKFVDSGDGRNIRNVLFSGCGNNTDDFDQLCSSDYLKEIWPYYFSRLIRTRCRNEDEFCNAAKELHKLVSSYNQDYVLEPFKQIKKKKFWLSPTPTPERKAWLSTLPEQHRTNVEKQIEDFRERWVKYIDDFVLFLDSLRDSLNCPRIQSRDPSFDSGQISSYFERPSKV